LGKDLLCQAEGRQFSLLHRFLPLISCIDAISKQAIFCRPQARCRLNSRQLTQIILHRLDHNLLLSEQPFNNYPTAFSPLPTMTIYSIPGYRLLKAEKPIQSHNGQDFLSWLIISPAATWCISAGSHDAFLNL
jgi:hypothetical protein